MISLLRTRSALSDRGKAFLAQLPLCVKDRAAGLPESLAWRLETGR